MQVSADVHAFARVRKEGYSFDDGAGGNSLREKNHKKTLAMRYTLDVKYSVVYC